MMTTLPRLLFFFSGVTLLLSGCVGGPDIPITSGDLHSLKAEGEIRLLYYPLSTMANFYVQSCPVRYDNCRRLITDPPLFFEDPLSTVQAQVTGALRDRLGLHNIRTVRRDAPLSEHPFPLDEPSLSRGVVFKLNTQSWQVKKRFLSYAPPPGTELPVYYNLSYSVGGTLFRDGESNLLWKARCKVDLSFEASADILLQKALADENSLVHMKRREAGASCAQQLLEKFFVK